MRNAKLKEVIEHHLRYEIGMLFCASDQIGGCCMSS
jgi:hypothetical protein